MFAFGYRPIIEKFLTENSDDWFRLSSENYVLWTNADLAALALGIQGMRGLGHFTVFATAFEANSVASSGVMPQEFWNWLYKPRPW
jgi:hypothetical protein